MIDHQHVGPLRGKALGDWRQASRRKLVVTVDEPEISAARVPRADIAGDARPDSLLVDNR
jgi:hypothetical protein